LGWSDWDRIRATRSQARRSEHTLAFVPAPWVQELLRAMDEAVFVVDSDGGIREVNVAAVRLLGHEAEDMAEIPFGLIVRGSADVLEDLEPGPPQRADLLAVTRDGLEIPVDVTFSRVEDGSALCVVRDTSLQVHMERELRLARQAAQVAAQERTLFLATMSHEIRTPLNGVLGMAGLLADSPLAPDQRQMVDAITNSGGALLDLVNDVLDFARIDSGQIELEVVPFDLAAVAEELIGSHAAAAAAKTIDVVVDLDPALPPKLLGDPGRLRQALGKLLGNAIKFTNDGYIVLAIRVLRTDDLDVVLECEVRDTGVGISDDLRERLFRPFVQADLTTSRRHGGSGLGLAIARRIVRLMGGELELDSAPGRGSRFTFRIDLRRAEDVPAAVDSLDLARRRVLVVSDLAPRRVALTRRLAAWGAAAAACEAAVAAGRLGAAVRRSSPYELVVVDPPLGAEDPLVVPQAICDLELEAPPSIVLLSVSPASLPTDTLVAACIATVIGKPVRRDVLRSAVRLLLQPSTAVDHRIDDLPAIPKLRGEGTRVLIAEDNPINQKVAVGYLAAMGVPADAVGNGLEAVEATRRYPYTLVLMDLHMPEIDGLSATAQIRCNERGARVPIVGLTADVRAESRARTEAVGMDAFLAKPVTPQKLAEVIARWIPRASPVGESREDPAGPVIEAMTGAKGAVIDVAALRRLRMLEEAGSQSGLVESLVGMFLQRTPARLERISRACEAGQHGFVEIEAHSLKSSCRNLGAERMGAYAAELERRAQAGDADVVAVRRLTREFQTVASILRRL
jgi:PAS domain S-box-containing protein